MKVDEKFKQRQRTKREEKRKVTNKKQKDEKIDEFKLNAKK